MPIYEYVCGDCKEKFEKLVLRRSDEAVVPCPHCGGKHTTQVYSTFATANSSTDSSSAGACARGGRFT